MGYSYAEKLYENAKSYSDPKAKAGTLKAAYNAAVNESNYLLAEEIKAFARSCGIDLDNVSGYY